jgi:type I restriction enzyme S subunit
LGFSDNLPYEKVGKNEPVCIADEVPFDIPESWEWVRLGNIGDWGSGATPNRTTPEYYNGNIPWLKTGDLNDNYITDIPETITELALAKTSVRLNPIGSVLIAMYGATIGKLGILKIPATTNQACCACVPFTDIYNEFLFYFLMSQKVAFVKRGEGGAQPNISKEKIVSTLMPLPPVAEQKRIVEKLRILQPYIDYYAVLEKSDIKLTQSFPEKLKKCILQYAVQGKLVPQDPADEPASVLLERIRAEKEQLIKKGKIKRDKHESVIFRRDNSYYEISGKEEVCIDDEIPFEIPDSWVWVRLGTALNQASTGPFGSMVHKEDYVESGIPIVNPANIIHGNISSEKIKKVSNATANRLSSYKLKAFDIIIGRRGEMGRSAVVESHQEGWLCGTGCFFVTPSKLLLPQYLVFLLNSPFVKAALTENSVGTTMNNLNHNILQSLLIPVPPINEQKKIMTNYQKSTAILDG